jgi:transcriptional regulator with XRE-family HTH domain
VTAIINHGALAGPTIAAIRKHLGISQATLAAETGVAASQISKYETCKVIPDLDTTARLLAGLGYPLCAAPRATVVAARQRQAVIDAATRMANDNWSDPTTDISDHASNIANAVALLHAADPFDDSDNPYTEIDALRRDLITARQQITDMRAAIAAAHYALVEAIR